MHAAVCFMYSKVLPRVEVHCWRVPRSDCRALEPGLCSADLFYLSLFSCLPLPSPPFEHTRKGKERELSEQMSASVPSPLSFFYYGNSLLPPPFPSYPLPPPHNKGDRNTLTPILCCNVLSQHVEVVYSIFTYTCYTHVTHINTSLYTSTHKHTQA